MTLRWHVYVDWDGDGNFEADEGDRLQDLTVERGRDRMFDRGGLVPMGVGKAKLRLDNWDGRFDAWNSGSPLYPNVLPNREVWIRVQSGGVVYDVMRGTGQEVVTYGYDEPRAELPVEDGWRFLQSQDSEHAVVQNVPTGTAIATILAASGWPWGTNLDAGSDTIPYWWAHGEAARQVHELVAAEFGFAAVLADGTFRFVERHNQFGSPPQITVTQAELIREPEFSQPSEVIRNAIRVYAQPRTPGTLGDVWKLGEVLQVRPKQTETLFAELDNPAVGLITPQANTDYTAHTQPSGGIDITSDVSVSMTAYSRLVRLRITNNNEFSDAYLTLLKVRGRPLTAVRTVATADDAASQADYGPLRLEMDYPWVQSLLRARNEAEWLLSWLSTPSPAVRVVIEDRPALQFGYDLGTVLNLEMPHVGLDATFQIGGIRHQFLHPNGSAVRTTWNLEPVRLQDYWVLGTSRLGLTTRLGF